MGNQIIKHEGKELSNVAIEIMEQIRMAWKPKEKEVSRTVCNKETGESKIVSKMLPVTSPLKKLNEGVSQSTFLEFLSLVSTVNEPCSVKCGHKVCDNGCNILKEAIEERLRISNLIEIGLFECEKALQAFNVSSIVIDRKMKPETWNECESLNTPSLATIVKYKGEAKAADLLHLMLMSFARKFGRRNDMNEADIKELAEDIVNDYRTLNIADIKKILNDVLSNESSTRFNMDAQTITAIFKENRKAKEKFYIKKAEKQHLNFTYGEKFKRERDDLGKLKSEGLSMNEVIQQSKIIADKRTIK